MKRDRNRLRVVRAEQRITQRDLSLKTKTISQSRLSLIENGYEEPTKDEREALALALGVQVEEIFPLGSPEGASA